jgi:hypothetical protein
MLWGVSTGREAGRTLRCVNRKTVTDSPLLPASAVSVQSNSSSRIAWTLPVNTVSYSRRYGHSLAPLADPQTSLCKGKGKGYLRTDHESPVVKRYGYTLSLTSALDGVGGQRHVSATLTPGNTRYPLSRRWVGPRAGLDRCGKFRPHRDSVTGRLVRVRHLSTRTRRIPAVDQEAWAWANWEASETESK